jgi:hypothetical protein
MLYLGIDQHARQITVSPRGETGDVLLAPTEPDRIHAFFGQLTRDRLRAGSRSWLSWRCAASTTG